MPVWGVEHISAERGLKKHSLPCQMTARVHNPPECATPIQLCVGSWSSRIGSSDVMRTLHTSARPVSRQGTIVFDPRVPATPRVPLRCVRYYDSKIRFRSTKTLCRAGSGVAHSGGLCTLDDSYHGIGVRRSAFAADLPGSSTRSPSIHQMWPELLLTVTLRKVAALNGRPVAEVYES